MINADPLRTPSFVLFGNDDFFFDDGFEVPCPTPGLDAGCAQQDGGFAWNHGDDQPQIASTWQGWVGPGIQNLGTDGETWTDHTDAQPTMLSLLGLSDDYTPDGRAISQIMTPADTPAPIAADPSGYDALSTAYKQLDAPFGEFGRDSLRTLAGTTHTRQDAHSRVTRTCVGARSARAAWAPGRHRPAPRVHLPGASQPTSRAGHRRLRAEPRRDWARR
jgi:hypothetical protein